MTKSAAFLLSVGSSVLLLGFLAAAAGSVAAAALLIFGEPVLDSL
jgi:hypothetical protein